MRNARREHTSRGRWLTPRFRRYMRPTDWKKLKKGLTLNGLSGLLNGVALTVIMPAVTSLQSGTAAWHLHFWQWMIILAILAPIASAASFFGVGTGYRAGLGFMRHMQDVIGNKVARLPLGVFTAASAGRLSRMVTQEMLLLGQTVAYFTGQLLKNITSALVFCLGAWIWDLRFGLILTLAIPVLFVILRLAQACVGKGSELEDPAEAEVAARIVEFAKCQGALRACHAGSNYPELKQSFEKNRKDATKGLVWGSFGNFLSGMGSQITVVILIVLAVRAGSQGSLDPLQTLVAIGVALRFTTILSDISGSLFAMEERRQMMNGLDDVLDTPELSLVDHSRGTVKDASIDLSHVTFSYEPGKPVLHDISFTVLPRQMVALVGPSGSGKTTVIKLIARFYDIDKSDSDHSGAIKIGGIDVRDLTTDDLFRQISFVFQDVYLFNDTLRNNILMAKPDATDAALAHAADLAGVNEIVKRLPEGWNSLCGEGGRSLSGGERQRVSIARALLKQAPIVLFDEATSALDAENEANIVRSMETLRRYSTLLVVAHKLETIRMADRIIVLSEDGRIAEAGRHDDLLAAKGAYKSFWDKRLAGARWSLISQKP